MADYGDLAERAQHGNDVDIEGHARNTMQIAASVRVLSGSAYNLMRSGVPLIFLGGDHSISMGTVSAVARHFGARGRKLFVFWLDAHADYSTPSTSPTGYMRSYVESLVSTPSSAMRRSPSLILAASGFSAHATLIQESVGSYAGGARTLLIWL